MKYKIYLCCLFFLLSGCSLYYAKPYYTGAETMVVTGYGYTREESIRHARDSAEYERKKQGRGRIIILKEETTYTGALGSEAIDKIVKQAEDVTWTLGETKASRAIRSASSPKDYQTVLEFRYSE